MLREQIKTIERAVSSQNVTQDHMEALQKVLEAQWKTFVDLSAQMQHLHSVSADAEEKCRLHVCVPVLVVF